MRYIFFLLLALGSLPAFCQSTSELYVRLATKSGIKQPVPAKYASMAVKRPIAMDSVSLAHFHHRYATQMITGATLIFGGTAIMLGHIFAVAMVKNYNRDAVIAAATIGVVSMGVGTVVFPIGRAAQHKYKKFLRIELAKRGL